MLLMYEIVGRYSPLAVLAFELPLLRARVAGDCGIDDVA